MGVNLPYAVVIRLVICPSGVARFPPPPAGATKLTRLLIRAQVGRMVLNRNPDNFFHENEQLAFCPSMIVPGKLICPPPLSGIWKLWDQ